MEYFFGPTGDLDLAVSDGELMRRKYSTDLEPEVTALDQVLSHAVLQVGPGMGGPFAVKLYEGSVYDSWTVFFENRPVFSMGETHEGYSVRLFNPIGWKTWADAFCLLAEQHAQTYGRRQ